MIYKIISWLRYIVDAFNDGADSALGYPPLKDMRLNDGTDAAKKMP